MFQMRENRNFTLFLASFISNRLNDLASFSLFHSTPFLQWFAKCVTILSFNLCTEIVISIYTISKVCFKLSSQRNLCDSVNCAVLLHNVLEFNVHLIKRPLLQSLVCKLGCKTNTLCKQFWLAIESRECLQAVCKLLYINWYLLLKP